MKLRAAVLVLVGSLVIAPAAAASWTGSGNGSGASKAESVSAGATPTVSVSGRNVIVSWSSSALSGGGSVDGYTVKRFDASSGTQQSIGSGCAGTVAALTCTETAVPAGSWKYSVTPVFGPWRGSESSPSATATVVAANVSLSAPTTLSSLPGTLAGSLASFATGETIAFRLDDPTTGAILSGSATPSTIGPSGSASISVTVPSGTSNGSHTLHVIGSGGTTVSASFDVGVDVTDPAIAAAAIAKTEGGAVARVRQGGTYRVYAAVSDPGSPSSGIASVTADVGALTSGQTAAPLSSGSWTVGGATYNYRSAQLTVAAALVAGNYTFSVTATDGAGRSRTQNAYAVTVDNTGPSATGVQAANGSGQTGKPEAGDTVTLTYGEALDPESVLAGWSGSSTPVTVRIVDGGVGNDLLQVWNAANTAQLPLGQVNLGRNDYVTASGSFTASTLAHSSGTLTITLGTASGTFARVNAGTMVWTPSALVWDGAGNAGSSLPVTESGANDRDF